MGLLDSDAEELKRNKNGENTSGRKVNQSGLGALKGLSKYTNLTAKYRTTGKSEKTLDAESVEHSRGTSSKSVQSQCEVSAEKNLALTLMEENKVSAKSVQSRCDLNEKPQTYDDVLTDPKSVQSPCNDPIGLVSNIDVEEPKTTPTSLDEVSAKSVQSQGSKKKTSETDAQILHDNLLEEAPSKSVQSQCNTGFNSSQIEYTDVIVRAKSVQSADRVEILKPLEVIYTEDLAKTGSQCKVSAVDESKTKIASPNEINEDAKLEISKSVQSQCEVSADSDLRDLLPLDSKVGAKSVQSQCKPGSPDLFKDKFKVSANSVQSQCEVSANRTAPEVDAVMSKVSAKSVQVAKKVSAPVLEDNDFINSSKLKVVRKNIEVAEPTESIISIAGSQRVIVDFLFQLCLWNNSLVTPPITKQQLTSETGLLEETALSSIKRLRKKNIIDRYAYKDGKAGWTQYQFSENSYKELLHLREVSAKSVQRLPAESPRNINAPVVSMAPGKMELWFKNLDFSKIHPIGPMVVNPAIRSLVEEKLTPELVQDFINRFTSWTSTQGRITSPIGLFCDKLKELVREGDSPIFTCMTEEERQVEAVFAAQVEKAKVEMELIRKARSEVAVKEADSAFENWYNSSDDSEKFQLAEPSSFAPLGSEAYKRILRASYFEKGQS